MPGSHLPSPGNSGWCAVGVPEDPSRNMPVPKPGLLQHGQGELHVGQAAPRLAHVGHLVAEDGVDLARLSG